MTEKVECPICGKEFGRKGLPAHFSTHEENWSNYKDEITPEGAEPLLSHTKRASQVVAEQRKRAKKVIEDVRALSEKRRGR